MRVNVITRHAPSNYGSLLQAMATVWAIEKMGHECEIIDYVRPDEVGIKGLLMQLRNKPNYNNNIIKKIAYILLRYPDEKLAEVAFLRMRKMYLKQTSLCRGSKDLKLLEADAFMTGSDQVWGPVADKEFDSSYFLDFVEHGTKKVAYSASFGRAQNSNTLMEICRKFLPLYDGIAVREKSAVEILAEVGVNDVVQVLDPVFLMSSQEWSKYIHEEQKERYVLVYQIHNDRRLNDYALRFSKQVGLPLRRVSPSLRQIFRGGQFCYLPSVSDFLSQIKGCSYLITDSFHGTAFALIFNRQFVEVLPNNPTGTRNQSILQLMGLSNRILADFDDFSLASVSIDYSKVNNILSKERENSRCVLEKMLNS